MKQNQIRAMHAKAKLSRDEWQQIVNNNKTISEEKRKYQKYFKKINNAGGFAFSDLNHLKRAESVLDAKLEKLADKHNYKQHGYTAYQPWLDHPTSR